MPSVSNIGKLRNKITIQNTKIYLWNYDMTVCVL